MLKVKVEKLNFSEYKIKSLGNKFKFLAKNKHKSEFEIFSILCSILEKKSFLKFDSKTKIPLNFFCHKNHTLPYFLPK